jgi:nitrate reductase NapD
VQTRPEKLDGAIDAIEALQGAEIFGRDPKGKIVVVLEAMDVNTIGETLGAISALPGVLTASLVFHGTTE